VPAVAGLRSDTRVAGLAQRHEIVGVAAATFREWKDVMYLLGGYNQSLFLTLLTEWVCLDVSVTDAFPSTTVPLVGCGITFVPVVLFVHDLLVFGAVLLTFGKPTAAGISTGTLRFIGHGFTSSRA
jgi:hypothetical protein